VATGCEPARQVLQRACAQRELGTQRDELSFLQFCLLEEGSGGVRTERASSNERRSRGQAKTRPAADASAVTTLPQAQSNRVDNALHDIIRYLEHSVDVLMQRQGSELVEEDEERLRIICERLLQICR
jgi:hypothetical protein